MFLVELETHVGDLVVGLLGLDQPGFRLVPLPLDVEVELPGVGGHAEDLLGLDVPE